LRLERRDFCLELGVRVNGGCERRSRVSQGALNPRCERVLAAEHAPRNPYRVIERRHGLAEIIECGAFIITILLRAGARHVTTFAMDLGYNHVYFQEIAASGGFKKYEQKHREDLVAMLAPKLPQIPKDVIELVVNYWAHVGDYPYFVSSDDFDTENETEDESEGRYRRPDYSSR